MKPVTRLSKYAAEAAGAFCLVFAGTGAVVVDQVTGGGVGALGVSLVFGLVVLAMVYAVGHISGAHLNPAVTLGFYSAGRLPAREIAPYLAAQLAGAVLASAALRLLFWGEATSLGMTLPSGPWPRSLGFEFLLTAILMFVVMAVATDHRAQGVMAGVAIGATIALEAILGGPVSGASMNPARSFGPALLSWDFGGHWLYWAGPIAGALFGAAAYRAVQCDLPATEGAPGCC